MSTPIYKAVSTRVVAACLLACLAPACPAAVDVFLQLDGIEGGCTNDPHSGWIEVLVFDHGVSQSADDTSSGGRSAGRADLQDFTIVKAVDRSSPSLALHCANGRTIPECTVNFVRTPDSQPFYTITMENILVTGFRAAGHKTNAIHETVSLRGNFGEGIEWEYEDRVDTNDLSAPFVSITSTAPREVAYTVTNFTLAGTITNVVGSLKWANAANETTVYFAPLTSNTWAVTVSPLDEGLNTITISGTNAAGKQGSDMIALSRAVLGAGLPSVAITNAIPSNVLYAVTSTVLTGTNNLHVNDAMWWTNLATDAGAAFSATGRAWTVTIEPLATGLNRVYVFGSNAIGRVASDGASLSRGDGSESPFLQITNSTPSNLTHDVTGYPLSGTNNSHVSSAMWWVNTADETTGTFSAVGSAWSVTATGLKIGVNTIYVYGSNDWQELAYDSISLTRDRDFGPPFVDITNAAPASNLPYAVTSYRLHGTNNATVNDAMWWVNSTNETTGTFTAVSACWTTDVTGLLPGMNVVYVYGSNQYDQVAYDSISIPRSLDTGTPFVNITNAAPGSNLPYAVTSYALTGTNNTHVDDAMWWVNTTNEMTGTFSAVSCCWTVNVTGLVPGMNVIYVYGSNQYDQLGYDVMSIGRAPDTGAPYVDITNASSSSALSLPHTTTAYTLYGTNNSYVVEDGMCWINTADETAGSFAATGGTWTATVTGLDPGMNTIYVYGSNTYGQQAYDTLSLYRDYPPGTRYVSLVGSNRFPYTSWDTAATRIQSAVDSAEAGEWVVVDSGTYQVGGRPAGGLLQSRLVIDKPVCVQSFAGPDNTTIRGGSDAGVHGPNALRCVYLTNGAALVGFTLSGGFTRLDGDILDQSAAGVLLDGGGLVSNCVISANSAADRSGGVYCRGGGLLLNCRLQDNIAGAGGGGIYLQGNGTIRDCLLTGNKAAEGAGVYFEGGGVLSNCALSANEALGGGGGGAFCNFGGTLDSCVVSNNTAERGAGVYCELGGTLLGCELTHNSAMRGGGVYCSAGGTIESCTIHSNAANGTVFIPSIDEDGGGGIYCVQGGTVRNCVLHNNHAERRGGGIYYRQPGGMCVNSTLSDNSAVEGGGGVFGFEGGNHWNSIVYHNTATIGEPDQEGTGLTFDYCCTPNAQGGIGNVPTPPEFADQANYDYQLTLNSPCIDTANEQDAPVDDRNGTPRPLDGNDDEILGWDIGAYEFAHPTRDSDGDEMPDGWEAGHGLNPLLPNGPDGADGDPDGDGADNLDEYTADTDPLNNDSLLVLAIRRDENGEIQIDIQGGQEAHQYIERHHDLLNTNDAWLVIRTNLPPTPIADTIPDPDTADPLRFYRIRVERP